MDLPPEEFPLCRRLALAALASFQNSLIGGLLYGWAAIDRTLLSAPVSYGGAGLNVSESTVIFSRAACAGCFSALLLGIVLDRSGPRVCSIASHAFVIAGCLLFTFSTSFVSLAFATGLISFGGPGIQVSIVHLANLFPENRFFALSVINGTIFFSMSVFALFDWLWELDDFFSCQLLFGIFSLLVAVSMAASHIFWPNHPYTIFVDVEKEMMLEAEMNSESETEAATLKSQPRPPHVFLGEISEHQHLIEQSVDSTLRDDENYRSIASSSSFRMSKVGFETGTNDLISLKDRSFWHQLQSGTYLRAVLIFVVHSFLANFYVVSFTTERADFHDFDPSTQHDLARIFTLLMSSGIFGALIVGTVMDQFGLNFCTAITSLLGMIQLAIILLARSSKISVIASFVFYVLFRSFLYPVFIGKLTASLGFKYFGLLLGLGFAASGVAQFFMAGLVDLVAGDCHKVTSPITSADECSSGGWFALHTFEIATLLILSFLPMIDHDAETSQERRIVDSLTKSGSHEPVYEL